MFATRAGEARKILEAEEIADNSEEDAAVAFATRAGGARETDKTRRKEAGVIDKAAGRVEESGVESPVDGGQGYT